MADLAKIDPTGVSDFKVAYLHEYLQYILHAGTILIQIHCSISGDSNPGFFNLGEKPGFGMLGHICYAKSG